MSQGMISSPANLSAVHLVGVQPETERDISWIDEAIVEGGFFSGDDTHNIVMGGRLAELLEVGVGDRVVVTVAQAQTGDLTQELFRVSGPDPVRAAVRGVPVLGPCLHHDRGDLSRHFRGATEAG